MSPQYTPEQADAELQRRARSQLGGAVPLGPGTAGRVGTPGTTPAPDTSVMPSGQAVQQAPQPEAPDNPRRSLFSAGMGSLGTGVQEALYNTPLSVNKLLGLGGFETTKRLFIDPLESRLKAVREREAANAEGAGLGEQVVRATTRGVGNLASLPADIYMGSAVKAGSALAKGVEVAPQVATSAGEMLNAIPSFALGAGIRKTGEEGSISGLPKGIAEGLAMEKVGEIGKNMSAIPKAITQTAAQGGLGAAMTTAETFSSEGRLPTKEELAVAAASNAAMALPFSAVPEKMGVKRDMSPAMRKEFEKRIGDLVQNDKISALPDETLAQLRDTAGKLAEYDPANQAFLTGLLELDREQQRRTGVEPQVAQLGKPDETTPVEQRPYSRTELAGLASGDLNAQERLMEIADTYGIQEPHKMEPGALLDAIDTAETGRQAEAQRQQDAAQAVVDMQSQAEQARNDILAATDEAGRLDAIKRFEDATKALSQTPALPAGQGFGIVGEPEPVASTSAKREQMAREVMQPQPEWEIPGPEPQTERGMFDRKNEDAFGGSIPYATELKPSAPPMEAGPSGQLEQRAQVLDSAITEAAQTGDAPDAQIAAEREAIGKRLSEDDAARAVARQADRAEPGALADAQQWSQGDGQDSNQPSPDSMPERALSPKVFAERYGIPETPAFLEAIKMYQDITGEGRGNNLPESPPDLVTSRSPDPESVAA